MHDTMINSSVELLEEKGDIAYSDWEKRIKKNPTKEKPKSR
jgi:hypothetical protein